jgi:hypothetical protein
MGNTSTNIKTPRREEKKNVGDDEEEEGTCVIS